MPLPAVLAGIAGTITASLKFTENPIVAYLIVLVFLIGDGAMSAVVGWQGVSGALFSWVINMLIAPFSIEVFSWQVLIIIGCAWFFVQIWVASMN